MKDLKINFGLATVMEAVRHMWKILIKSHLLCGYMILGIIISAALNGLRGLVQAVGNIIIIAIFSVLIRCMTIKTNSTSYIKKPLKETVSGVIFLIVQGIVLLVLWEQVNVPLFSEGIKYLFHLGHQIVNILSRIGTPDWLLPYIGNAVLSIFITLIPTLILFGILGYRVKRINLRDCNFKLIITLFCITILIGLPFKVIGRYTLLQTIAIYIVHLFINGVPEELLFRGFLLSRIEKVMGNSINALIIVSILFNLIHVPQQLYNGSSLLASLIGVFSLAFPSGLIWGYLYLRTRSIIPGALWHTSFGVLGIYLIS